MTRKEALKAVMGEEYTYLSGKHEVDIYEAMYNYARRMIVADRERIKENAIEHEDGTVYVMVIDIDETPIILE